MNRPALLKQPLFWLACVGVALLLVLALWHVTRPTDATGQSLILPQRAQKAIRQDLQQQVARRRTDSVRAGQAQAAATALYRQGQLEETNASRLHQRAHENRPPSDTSAQRLQQLLTNY